MKKIIWAIPVLALAAVFSAFTLRGQKAEKATATDMFFLYDKDNVPTVLDPGDYLDDANWIFQADQPDECPSNGNATCFITIPAAALSGFSGTNAERLVQFLEEQNGGIGEFSDPVTAVVSLRGEHTKISQ